MIDLHLHSSRSDGRLRPSELVERGRQLQLSALALTDHDTTGGVDEFLAAADGAGLLAVPGVEISAQWHAGTMHILGYLIDHHSDALQRTLEWIRQGRSTRNREICRRLNQLGYEILWDDIVELAGGDVVGRPHIAEALVRRGYVATPREAFDTLLAEGRPAYVGRRRLPPEQCIDVIHASGGLAVLAHPVTLGLNESEMLKLVGELASKGLDGIECYYPEHSQEYVVWLLRLCERFDLIPTGGTDFHGDTSSGIEMGTGTGNLVIPDSLVSRLFARWERRNSGRNPPISS